MLTYDIEGRYIVYIDYALLNGRRAGLFHFQYGFENFCFNIYLKIENRGATGIYFHRKFAF